MVAASIFLPSYNKGEYAIEAIESVKAQTFTDWECWILENSTDGKTRELIQKSGVVSDPRFIYREIDLPDSLRKSKYAAAYLLNEYYPRANGEYIFYLSDDDLYRRDCLECCVWDFNAYPDHEVIYFAMEFYDVVAPRAAPAKRYGTILPTTIRTTGELEAKIDGGQVVHKKRCLDKLTQPYFSENPDGGCSDGKFLERLALHFPFYPFMKVLAEHRTTPLSTWTSYDPQIGRLAR